MLTQQNCFPREEENIFVTSGLSAAPVRTLEAVEHYLCWTEVSGLTRLAAALCPATADSLQFRPETAAAGDRATGLLQALGG